MAGASHGDPLAWCEMANARAKLDRLPRGAIADGEPLGELPANSATVWETPFSRANPTARRTFDGSLSARFHSGASEARTPLISVPTEMHEAAT